MPLEIAPFVDAAGLHIATYPDYLAALTADYLDIYPDANLAPDTQDGQWTSIIALAQYDAALVNNYVYSSFSPATAQGQALSNNVKINGIRRTIATYSTVDLLIVGQVGTIISGGQAEDTLGQKWILPTTVTIPVSGEVTVTATAEINGAVSAAANTVTTISTPTLGWQSVTNPAASSTGAPVENDAQLRLRQQASTMLPSQTPMDGILGGISQVTGVEKFRGYENNSAVGTISVSLLLTGTPTTVITGGQVQDALGQIWQLPATVTIGAGGMVTVTAAPVVANASYIDANTATIIVTPEGGWSSVTNPAASSGQPPHSIAIVVEGGDSTTIAGIIARKVNQGVEMYGTTAITVYDRYAQPTVVRFFRPRTVTIGVRITLIARAGYLNTTGDAIKQAVSDYIGTLMIGESIYLTKLYVPANLSNTLLADTFDVTLIELSKDGSPYVAANLAIAFDELSVCATTNVTVIVI